MKTFLFQNLGDFIWARGRDDVAAQRSSCIGKAPGGIISDASGLVVITKGQTTLMTHDLVRPFLQMMFRIRIPILSDSNSHC